MVLKFFPDRVGWGGKSGANPYGNTYRWGDGWVEVGGSAETLKPSAPPVSAPTSRRMARESKKGVSCTIYVAKNVGVDRSRPAREVLEEAGYVTGGEDMSAFMSQQGPEKLDIYFLKFRNPSYLHSYIPDFILNERWSGFSLVPDLRGHIAALQKFPVLKNGPTCTRFEPVKQTSPWGSPNSSYSFCLFSEKDGRYRVDVGEHLRWWDNGCGWDHETLFVGVYDPRYGDPHHNFGERTYDYDRKVVYF